MRDMAGHGEHQIVMLRLHDFDARAKLGPKFRQKCDLGCVRAVGRCQYAPTPLEQGGKASLGAALLGSGHRMGRDDGMIWQSCCKVINDALLGRANIADDRVTGQGIGKFAGRLLHGAHRDTQNDQIGIANRFLCAAANRIDQTPLRGNFAHSRVGVIPFGSDLWREFAHGQADGAAQ